MRREDSRSGLGLEPAALRQRFARAFAVRRAIYWADLLASATIGWAAFAASGWLHPWWLALTALLVATLALYRAVLFIHELAHLRRGALPGFALAWNLVAGLPLGVPSILYVGTHGDHHRRNTYGTVRDPEYEPIAHWRPLRIAASTLPMPLLPALIAVRWLVLGPLGWLALALVAGGVLAPHWVGHRYAVATAILVLNHLRTLAAHRYRHTGAPVDATAQVLDTVNVDGAPVVTALLAPVGLRYHGLHHLLPSLPYHSLGAVHRALLAELPADSPYRRTEAAGLAAALRELLEAARADRPPRTAPGR